MLNDHGKYLQAELEVLLDHLSLIRKNLSGAAAAVQGVFQKVKREGYKIYSEVEAGRVTCEAR